MWVTGGPIPNKKVMPYWFSAAGRFMHNVQHKCIVVILSGTNLTARRTGTWWGRQQSKREVAMSARVVCNWQQQK